MTEILKEEDKQDFQRYLEEQGTVEALTNALVKLFEEKSRPENATEFIKQLDLIFI